MKDKHEEKCGYHYRKRSPLIKIIGEAAAALRRIFDFPVAFTIIVFILLPLEFGIRLFDWIHYKISGNKLRYDVRSGRGCSCARCNDPVSDRREIKDSIRQVILSRRKRADPACK